MSGNIDFNSIARATSGASGADLANIINEAALRAVRLGRNSVIQADLDESVETVIAGAQRKNAVLSAKEKEIVLAQMANDPKTANKPDAIKEKMAIGKLGKFFKESCLVDQAFIKDGNMDVKKYVQATAKELGGDIKIVSYTHFVKGEGLEKRNEDFAAEVAAAMKG